MFQLPQICRPLDRVGHLLCFPNRFVKLPTQSSVESCAGDDLFRLRPGWFVLVRIAVLVRRRDIHVPIPRGGILFLGETSSPPVLSPPQIRNVLTRPYHIVSRGDIAFLQEPLNLKWAVPGPLGIRLASLCTRDAQTGLCNRVAQTSALVPRSAKEPGPSTTAALVAASRGHETKTKGTREISTQCLL